MVIPRATPPTPRASWAASPTDRAGGRTRYQYDGAGRLTAIADALGALTRDDYDPWQRPRAATFPDGRVETYHWTPTADDPEQAQLTALGDADGRLAELAWTDGHLSRLAWRDGETLTFRHDADGRVIEAAVGEQVVHFTYDDAGR